MVGVQALQTAFDRPPNVVRPAVDAAVMGSGLGIDVPAEFGGDLHAVAHRRQRFADHLLVAERPIGFRGIEEVDAAVDRIANQRDHLCPVGNLACLAVAHAAQR